MTTTNDVAKSLVTQLGGNPNNAAIVRAVQVWIASESGSVIYGNNPLNMRPGNEATKPVGTDASGFSVFGTLDQGVSATAQRLQANDTRGYAPIAAAIKGGSVTGFYTALVKSKWDASNYGGNISKLMGRYNSGSTYNSTLSFKFRSGSPVITGSNPTIDTTSRANERGTDPTATTNAVTINAGDTPIVKALKRYFNANNLTASSPLTVDQFWKATTGLPGFVVDSTEAQQIANNYVGHTWGDVLSIAAQGMSGAAPDPFGLNAAIASLGGIASHLLGFVVALILIIAGIWLYARGTSQTVRSEG